MSTSGSRPEGPSREQVEAKLLDLIVGRCDRADAASWASAYIDKDALIRDKGVREAVVSLSGADLPTTDRQYLHGEADFCIWLEQLKRSAR